MGRRDPRAAVPPVFFALRASFGLVMVAFGIVMLVNVARAPGALAQRGIGAAFGLALIALGGVRIVQYVHARRAP